MLTLDFSRFARTSSACLFAFFSALCANHTLYAEEEKGETIFVSPDTPAEDAAPAPSPRTVQIRRGEPVPVSNRLADPKPGDAPKPGPVATTDAAAEQKGYYLPEDAAIEIALLNNLGLKLARLNDRAADINVRVAWAEFYPTFRTGLTHSNSRASGQNAGDGTTTLSGGIAQRTPWGTDLDFALAESRSKFDTDTATGSMSFNVRQPLWRGMGTDVNLAGVRTARINRLISRGGLDLQTQQLIFNVRTAYSDIISQIQSREVNRQAVRSAKTFLELSDAREKAGQVTKLDVFNADVQLRNRELDLLQTERALENAYDRLKVLMDIDLTELIRVDAPTIDFGDKGDPDVKRELRSDEVTGTVVLVSSKDDKPVGEPKVLFQAIHFDEGVILKEALDNRIQLLNARRDLAIQKLQTVSAKNGLGHQIDLVGGLDRTNAGRSIVEGDNGREVQGWNAGLQATFPWGKIRDRATYERALLDLQAAEINLKQVRTSVQSEVREIMRNLRELEKALMVEGRRVEAAKRSVEAAQISFDRGLKDSFDVIRAEDDLLRAKTQFITRKLAYAVRIAELETVVGKPTGRVDLTGQSVGGLIDVKLPDSVKERGLPKLQPDPEPRPEDDPFNNSREYRKDYKPNRSSPVQVDVPAK
ncbi:MAG TPA: TolC family protein [Planctomycetota bacterium]|nr:TolC family protein [Planctomycetota bacterium]